MTEREFFVYALSDETAKFQRLLSAIPHENQDYKPDPKSKTAIQIAQAITMESGTLPKILETGDLDFLQEPPVTSVDPAELGKLTAENLQKTKEMVEQMSDDAWEAPARMHMGGANEWKATKGKMVLSFLFDLIHHRGQISTYIRAMGGKVPSIYGPSADTE